MSDKKPTEKPLIKGNVITTAFGHEWVGRAANSLSAGISLAGWEKISGLSADLLTDNQPLVPLENIEVTFDVSIQALCSFCDAPLEAPTAKVLDEVLAKKRNAGKCPSCGLRLVRTSE